MARTLRRPYPSSVLIGTQRWRIAVEPGRLALDPGQDVGPMWVRGYLDADDRRIVIAGGQSLTLAIDAYWELIYRLRRDLRGPRRWRLAAFPRTPDWVPEYTGPDVYRLRDDRGRQVCPHCRTTYTTPGGFGGHLLKRHGILPGYGVTYEEFVGRGLMPSQLMLRFPRAA